MSCPLPYHLSRMNKDKSQFAHLPLEDRRFLLDLCARQSYDTAVEILAQPRSAGGLGLRTSRSALSRFFTTSQLEAPSELVAQRAAVAQICYEQRSNTFLAAIRAEIEARVLESLHQGKALADLEKDFRLLKNAQSLYRADAQWRARNPKEARAAYRAHVDSCAQAPETDFVLIDDPSTPPGPPEPSPFAEEVAQARLKQKRQEDHRQSMLAQLTAASFGHLANTPTSRSHPSEPAKTPVIPHIPPNPTSSINHPSHPEPSPAAPPSTVPKRTPFVRAHSKIGRNDPCPCGSGHKYKRCCSPQSGQCRF